LIAMSWLAHEARGPHLRPLAVNPIEPVDTVHLPTELHFAPLTRVLGVPLAHLRALNPELTGTSIPAGYGFHLPRNESARFRSLTDSLVKYQDSIYLKAAPDTTAEDTLETSGPSGTRPVYYRIRSGDVLGTIARKHGVRVSQIKEWNDLKTDFIDVGEELTIHVPDKRPKARANGRTVPAPKPSPPAATTAEGYIWYTVRSGDSLDAIARRHRGVSAQDLMRLNGITPRIKPGQRIKVPK
jgi:membrane-bound lytic murein transglycosylase D